MRSVIHVLGTLLVVLTLTPALAHALEAPGKRHLGPDAYVSVQKIYYPGFTIAGAAEPLAIVAMALSAALTPWGADRWLRGFAFVALGAAHAVYWIRVHRINRMWLQGERLGSAGSMFFGEQGEQEGAGAAGVAAAFPQLRQRWERGHVMRASLAGSAMIAAVVALA